ncbi:MAG: exodeoxyribonuclease III [Saprospiraceae bacterium]
MLRLISYNVNGIRSALSKGLADWLTTENPDIVCFQETKAEKANIDGDTFENLGYHEHWYSAEKKGYSGVLILSKVAPDFVETGMGDPFFDREGRVIRADFGDLTVVNIYFPSGTSGEIRQDAKYVFLKSIFSWLEDLRAKRPNIIVVGDYNIAHTEIDIHDPKGNKNSSGFLPEERAWLDSFAANHWTDAYRHHNPGTQKYSWWSFRAGARSRNKGWRIDYQFVSTAMVSKIVDSDLLNDAVHSDHCPVAVTYDI